MLSAPHTAVLEDGRDLHACFYDNLGKELPW
jgi:hypothetical protein